MISLTDEVNDYYDAHDEAREDIVNLTDNLFTQRIQGLSQTLYRWHLVQGFWETFPDSDLPKANVGEKIALMHSELSEALEADRKQVQDDKIPQFSGLEVELADCIIRILDFAGAYKLDLAGALRAKMLYNLTRPYRHGKQY